MSSDIYFNVASWFPGNVRVKPHFNTQCPCARHAACSYNDPLFCCCPCFCFVSGYKLHLKSLDSRSLSIHFTYWLTQIKLWVLDQPLLPWWLLLQCKNYNYLSTFFVVALFFFVSDYKLHLKSLDSRSLSMHFTYWLTQINLWVLDQLAPFCESVKL